MMDYVEGAFGTVRCALAPQCSAEPVARADRFAESVSIRKVRRPMFLIACSGPGAGETIAHNIAIGNIHAGIVVGLFGVSLAAWHFAPRRWVIPTVLAVLSALHPAWTISAISGDCGFLKRDASWVVTFVGAFAVLCQAVRLWHQQWSDRVRGRIAEGLPE